MEQASKKAQLSDILPYQPDDYFSESELKWIKSTFSDKSSVRIIRKVFLPTFHDAAMPIEEMKNDPWMADIDFTTMPSEHVKAIVAARQQALKFIMNGLVKLKVIASLKEEDEVAAAARRAKDSSK